MMNDSIKKEVILQSDISKVWNAISLQDEISEWFLKADFKAEKDYAYTFSSKKNECEPIIGIVKSADPYLLVYTWIVTGTDVETTVQWQLESIEGGTKLTLLHTGISNYASATAIEMFESFNGGWDNCINGLIEHLA